MSSLEHPRDVGAMITALKRHFEMRPDRANSHLVQAGLARLDAEVFER